ncbi:hypothetical protein E8E13_009196 [Curvularia kusanoi]|uniref:rRNA adenine N(6)-methyltransferase n=1 Tax=Curvularia kusanoi TaxID=90978 RepID=A0A9P4WA38_CURKU|nr:hypothetical protein E8E13_009196 [Curvularia kusanoi]
MRYVVSRPQKCLLKVLTYALTDDVLKFYGKSLETHKGCDILDINPGAGLWSQKLHDFLQPRSHVLLESNASFKPFLEPLLDTPNSTYKLIQKNTLELETYADLVKEGVFPEQNRVDPEDTSGQELNTTLLVTGMLAWDPVLPGLSFDSMAKQLYNHFASAVRTNDYFHAYGRVRTLFWVGAEDFRPIIAESMSRYEKNNCLLELTQGMDMIVNAPRGARKQGRGAPSREPQYEVEGIVRAMQRARANGMDLPAHREDKAHKVAAEVEKLSGGSGKSSVTWLNDYLSKRHAEGFTARGLLTEATLEHQNQMLELQKRYPDIDLAAMGNAKEANKSKRVTNYWIGKEDHPARKEVTAWVSHKVADRAVIKLKEHFDSIADLGEEMYNAECRALRMQDGTEEKKELLNQIADMDKKLDKLMATVKVNYKVVPLGIMDDRISLRSPQHPRIQWDRRSFEPLTMDPEEAWPPHGLSLISSTPYPRPPGQTIDHYEWVQDFVYALFTIPSSGLPEALERMQHGLSELLEKCPSVRDPDKGGRLQMKHFRVRMLTNEMIEELVSAYRAWPFKEPGTDHNRYFRWKGSNRSQEVGAR